MSSPSPCCPARPHPVQPVWGQGSGWPLPISPAPVPATGAHGRGRRLSSAARGPSRDPGLRCCPLPLPASPCRTRAPRPSSRHRLNLSSPSRAPVCWKKVLSAITLHIATAISNLPWTSTSIIPFNPAPRVAARTREIIQAKVWYRACPTVGTCKKRQL